MKAKVGDWLVVKGTTIDKPDRRGLITEVHSPDGSPPYVVRWLETDHEATVFPGADSVSSRQRSKRKPTSARNIGSGPCNRRSHTARAIRRLPA